jgi:hypothetical protein
MIGIGVSPIDSVPRAIRMHIGAIVAAAIATSMTIASLAASLTATGVAASMTTTAVTTAMTTTAVTAAVAVLRPGRGSG